MSIPSGSQGPGATGLSPCWACHGAPAASPSAAGALGQTLTTFKPKAVLERRSVPTFCFLRGGSRRTALPARPEPIPRTACCRRSPTSLLGKDSQVFEDFQQALRKELFFLLSRLSFQTHLGSHLSG